MVNYWIHCVFDPKSWQALVSEQMYSQLYNFQYLLDYRLNLTHKSDAYLLSSVGIEYSDFNGIYTSTKDPVTPELFTEREALFQLISFLRNHLNGKRAVLFTFNKETFMDILMSKIAVYNMEDDWTAIVTGICDYVSLLRIVEGCKVQELSDVYRQVKKHFLRSPLGLSMKHLIWISFRHQIVLKLIPNSLFAKKSQW